MDLRPRTLIQRLNDAVNPAGADEQPEPAPATNAPSSATVPAQPVRGGGRLPDWRAPKKPIGVDDEPDEAPAEEADDVDYGDDGHEQHDHDHDDDDDEDEDDEGEGDADADEEKAPGSGRRWSRHGSGRRWSMTGSGKKTYRRPVYGHGTSPKQSLLEAWRGLRPITRHGLYNGAALAIAWRLHMPQFFTDETAYLVDTYHSWTDFYVCIWYGVAVAIWALDHRTRNWLPLFALLARIPLISLVVGVLLYGNPV